MNLEQAEARILELEGLLARCSDFFDLIPLSQLEKGMTWLPSEVCIQLGKNVKQSVNDFLHGHSYGVEP